MPGPEQRPAVLPKFTTTSRMLIGFALGAINLTGGKPTIKELGAAIDGALKNLSPTVSHSIKLERDITRANMAIPKMQDIHLRSENIISLTSQFNANDFETHGSAYISQANKIAAEGAPLQEKIAALKKEFADLKKEQEQINGFLNNNQEPPNQLTMTHEIKVKNFLTDVQKCRSAYEKITSKFDELHTLVAKSAPAAANKAYESSRDDNTFGNEQRPE